MARSQARIRTSVWRDDDFKALDASAQATYWMVLSQADVNMAGVVAYTHHRWATFRGDPDGLDQDLRDLEAADFLVIDRATHEVWIRSFAKNDGALNSIKTRGPMWSAWGAILSPKIRRRFLEQLDGLMVKSDNDETLEVVTEAIRKGWTTQSEIDSVRAADTPSDRGSDTPSDTPSERADGPPNAPSDASGYPQPDTPSDTPSDTPRAGARAASASSTASSTSTTTPREREDEFPPPPTPPPSDDGGGSSIPQDQPHDPDVHYAQRSIGRLPDKIRRKLDAETPRRIGALSSALREARSVGLSPGKVYAALNAAPPLDAGSESIAAVAAKRIRNLVQDQVTAGAR